MPRPHPLLQGEFLWPIRNSAESCPALSNWTCHQPGLRFPAFRLHVLYDEKLSHHVSSMLMSLSPQHALGSRLGRNDNAQFLEQFRYIIIASQLLNEHTNSIYNAVSAVREPTSSPGESEEINQFRYTWTGICCTAGVAFAMAWSAHMARIFARSYSSNLASYILYLILAIFLSSLFIILRRQWLLHIRNEAISAASSLVANAQSFDAIASATITLIQEVELVSRGYRM